MKRLKRTASLSTAGSSRRSLSVLLLVVAAIAVAVAVNGLGRGSPLRGANARLLVVSGQVEVQRADAGSEQLSQSGQTALVQSADSVTTQAGSAAILTCGESVRLELEPETTVTLLEMSHAGPLNRSSVAVSLDRGGLVSRLASGFLNRATLRVETRVSTLESTAGVVRCTIVDDQRTSAVVYEGTAMVSMGSQAVTLGAGQALEAALGQPLVPMLGVGGAPVPLVGSSATQDVAPTGHTVQPTGTPGPEALFPPIVTPTRPGDNLALYTVQSGDTLYSIARQHGVPWEAIWEANRSSLASPEQIKAGQQLRIPKP